MPPYVGLYEPIYLLPLKGRTRVYTGILADSLVPLAE